MAEPPPTYSQVDMLLTQLLPWYIKDRTRLVFPTLASCMSMSSPQQPQCRRMQAWTQTHPQFVPYAAKSTWGKPPAAGSDQGAGQDPLNHKRISLLWIPISHHRLPSPVGLESHSGSHCTSPFATCQGQWQASLSSIGSREAPWPLPN